MASRRRKILIVEDDPKTSEIIRLYLEGDGYQVLSAYDGAEGLKLVLEEDPDLVVLDRLLPGMDGSDVCRAVRNESDVPIIMLTALSTEADKLEGLDIGADDYVTKPFSPRELVARVRVVLRRTTEDWLYVGPQQLDYGELKIDFPHHKVLVEEKDVHLTPTEFRILAVMARKRGRVFSRTQLVDRALGYDYDGMERTVDVHVLNLRRKIETDSNKPRYIKTVYGMGYKFEG